MKGDARSISDFAPAKVLVVDDMATNRKLLHYALKPPEYEVIEACDGEEALRILKVTQVDVVLMDIMMPGIDGFETCRRIRKDLGLTLLPVIILTSLGEPDNVVRGMDVGADDYVTKPFNMLELSARVHAAIERKRLTDRLDDTESVLFSLARMVEARDENTGDHCSRLSHYGLVFGKALGLSFNELEALRRGGVLHDIGKLGIPDSILLKRGKLTPEEWLIMKQHTVIGAQLCSPLRTMTKAVDIVRSHHERQDGSGYPDGLRGEEVPLLARVFQILDIFDALSSERPYKPAFPREEVIRIMEEETARGYWDARLMKVFLEILRNRPEDLEQYETMEKDRSAVLLEHMMNSGVLDWYRKAGDDPA
ncbi:MAG: response regulator [Sulfuricella denitrificans]|nr:response regulator [Sulfuricella denitrificans]